MTLKKFWWVSNLYGVAPEYLTCKFTSQTDTTPYTFGDSITLRCTTFYNCYHYSGNVLWDSRISWIYARNFWIVTLWMILQACYSQFLPLIFQELLRYVCFGGIATNLIFVSRNHSIPVICLFSLPILYVDLVGSYWRIAPVLTRTVSFIQPLHLQVLDNIQAFLELLEGLDTNTLELAQ